MPSRHQQIFAMRLAICLIFLSSFKLHHEVLGVDPGYQITPLPRIVEPLTEPACSYCIEQNEKGFIRSNDAVLAWTRGAHNGGAFPLRYFLNKYRVLNDTYGLFMYDPENDFIAAYQKDYGYQFVGRIDGEMVVQGKDGTIWSALRGIGLSGPQKGKKLNRIPNIRTNWGHWLLLHPESTTYDLYDGKRYDSVTVKKDELVSDPKNVTALGIDASEKYHWFPVTNKKRHCEMVQIDGMPVCLFWYGPTKTAVAYMAKSGEMNLTFYADEISPLTAPFKDKETGTRWTLAGRAVDGPLRGKELDWIPSIQINKSAWMAAYPQSKQISHDDAK